MFSVAGTSERQAQSFLAALRKAISTDDRRRVALMVRYPIVVWARNRSLLVRSPASFVASYDLILTSDHKKAIVQQRTECLFTNWKGVMIHDGEIWLGARANGDLQIIAINSLSRGEPGGASRPSFKIHPKALDLIENLEPDAYYPIVTEINLDSVARNSNQFPPDQIKQVGEWVTGPTETERGFQRYRVLESANNRYTIEYQENDGGTYTSSVIIEFVVEKRAIKIDGKAKPVSVLKVLGFRKTM